MSYRGVFVAESAAPAVLTDVCVTDNRFRLAKFSCVDVFVSGAASNILIANNRGTMTANDDGVPASQFPSFVNYVGGETGVGPISGLTIRGNEVTRDASVSGRSCNFLTIALTAGGFGGIAVEGNTARGFTRSIYGYTNGAFTGTAIVSRNNRWLDPAGGTVPASPRIGKNKKGTEKNGQHSELSRKQPEIQAPQDRGCCGGVET